ncbi:hypothetical protein E2C01_017823 [Portunus trituberculatus]|uniref:Uncharacterized protein n=1 Tax=Portunus trituberculatus TaxID=210409 RepID=A0A5B7DTI0_PORTR|nr:hypothetical protein [Portunus trituberculatus]
MILGGFSWYANHSPEYGTRKAPAAPIHKHSVSTPQDKRISQARQEHWLMWQIEATRIQGHQLPPTGTLMALQHHTTAKPCDVTWSHVNRITKQRLHHLPILTGYLVKHTLQNINIPDQEEILDHGIRGKVITGQHSNVKSMNKEMTHGIGSNGSGLVISDRYDSYVTICTKTG